MSAIQDIEYKIELLKESVAISIGKPSNIMEQLNNLYIEVQKLKTTEYVALEVSTSHKMVLQAHGPNKFQVVKRHNTYEECLQHIAQTAYRLSNDVEQATYIAKLARVTKISL